MNARSRYRIIKDGNGIALCRGVAVGNGRIASIPPGPEAMHMLRRIAEDHAGYELDWRRVTQGTTVLWEAPDEDTYTA